MIQLASENLPADIQQVIDRLQEKVNKEKTFTHKASKAQSLWASKGGSSGKKAFSKIAEKLRDMCVYVGVCNYCEQNEANDIEHIYPKSFFPEHTFVWNNYLLACKQCNSAYKLDKCFVLNDADQIVEVVRQQEPAFKTVALINSRNEDPNQFMILTLASFKFELLPDLSLHDFHKATKTLDILQLNQRDTLKQARKSAAIYYYQRMNLLVHIIRASSITQIEQLLTPYDSLIDTTKPLQQIKTELAESFRKHIASYQHPSVWHSIKIIESRLNPRWKDIFQQLPDALTW